MSMSPSLAHLPLCFVVNAFGFQHTVFQNLEIWWALGFSGTHKWNEGMGSIPFIENYSNFMEYNFNMKTYLILLLTTHWWTFIAHMLPSLLLSLWYTKSFVMLHPTTRVDIWFRKWRTKPNDTNISVCVCVCVEIKIYIVNYVSI